MFLLLSVPGCNLKGHFDGKHRIKTDVTFLNKHMNSLMFYSDIFFFTKRSTDVCLQARRLGICLGWGIHQFFVLVFWSCLKLPFVQHKSIKFLWHLELLCCDLHCCPYNSKNVSLGISFEFHLRHWSKLSKEQRFKATFSQFLTNQTQLLPLTDTQIDQPAMLSETKLWGCLESCVSVSCFSDKTHCREKDTAAQILWTLIWILGLENDGHCGFFSSNTRCQ